MTCLQVVWLHEGKKVEENERVKLVNEGNFYCVDISPVTLDDEGIWKCQGHNARGLVTSQAKLTLVGMFADTNLIHIIYCKLL